LAGSTALFSQESVVVHFEGEVEWTRNGSLLDIDIGYPIQRGDKFATKEKSTVILQLSRGVEIKLRENTIWTWSQGSGPLSSRVDLGGAFVRVVGQLAGKPDVRLSAGSVVAGVRGTQFFMAYGAEIGDDPDVWMCVQEGLVNISSDESVDGVNVRAGEGVNILEGSRITRPRPYAWTEDLNWNMDPAAGTVKDETDLKAAYPDLLQWDYQ